MDWNLCGKSPWTMQEIRPNPSKVIFRVKTYSLCLQLLFFYFQPLPLYPFLFFFSFQPFLDALRLGLAGGPALYAFGDGTVDVVVGDPALVVGLVGARGHGGGLASGENLDGLVLLDLLGALARLGEEGLDPGLVDEVEGAAEDSGKEEVEEDARERYGLEWAREEGEKKKVKKNPGFQKGGEDRDEGRDFVKGGRAYICGSNKLVGGSTMPASPL